MSIFSKTAAAISALLLFGASAAFAQKATVSGYVRDAATGEPLIGAAVISTEENSGTVTGNSGFYSISLEPGSKVLLCSYLGYLDRSDTLDLRDNVSMNIVLTPVRDNISSAVVTAYRSTTGVRTTQMSTVDVPINQIKAIPALGGETDVIKALQLLPGVQSGTEGMAGIYVRGGGADENLLLMDGVPLYNVNHMLGFFSVFNADALKNVTLYKGSFPARFGGHLSSVIDVRMNDGNLNGIHGSASIGLISSKFNLEGPLIKGRTTFNISARRTYLDLLAKPVLYFVNRRNRQDGDNYDAYTGGYDFYDLNAKVTHRLHNDDRISLSFYKGDDWAHFEMKDASRDQRYDWSASGSYAAPTGIYDICRNQALIGWRWGNTLAALRWDHALSPRLYMSAVANCTRYRSRLALRYDEYCSTVEDGTEHDIESAMADVSYNSIIRDLSGGVDFDWHINPSHAVKFGMLYTRHVFKPGIITMKEEVSVSDETADPIRLEQTSGDVPISSDEAGLYAEDDWSVTPWLKANVGMRASFYSVNGKSYTSVEPRFSARALITPKLSFKTSYSEMGQYIHLLSNSNLSLPSDLWVPVTRNIRPMRSRQCAAGFFYDLNRWEFSVEGYYKSMDNVLEYRDGASYLGSTTLWEEKVCMGRGLSYGLELLAQKKIGKTTGWIGYTLARAVRQFDRPGMEINDGKPFSAKYDRRHDLSATVSHQFSDRFDLSATFVLMSGNCGSLGYENFVVEDLEGAGTQAGLHHRYASASYVPERNNYRMPAYNRLDLGMNFKKQKRHGMRIWNISVYNVYNRLNPFLVTTDVKAEPDGCMEVAPGEYVTRYKYRTYLKEMSFFPIMPSVSYTFKF